MKLRPNRVRTLSWMWLLPCVLAAGPAAAYTVTIGTGSKAAYLRIGDGSITGNTYFNGGTPAINTTVNTVSVTVPAASVGDGSAQNMTGSGRLTSDYDNFQLCTAGQVYIGAFFRLPNTVSRSATLTVTTPVNLINADGSTIPISQISWTSSGIGDTGAQPFPGNTFTGGTQVIATLLRNTWAESCHSFRYANAQVPAAGTYTARATYTLATP